MKVRVYKDIHDMEGEERELYIILDVKTSKTVKMETGKDILHMTQMSMETDFLTDLLYYAAKRGESNVTQDEIETVGLGQFYEVVGELMSMIAEFSPEEKEGQDNKKDPLARKKK